MFCPYLLNLRNVTMNSQSCLAPHFTITRISASENDGEFQINERKSDIFNTRNIQDLETEVKRLLRQKWKQCFGNLYEGIMIASGDTIYFLVRKEKLSLVEAWKAEDGTWGKAIIQYGSPPTHLPKSA